MPGKFVTPVVKDIAPINKTDIVMSVFPGNVPCLHFDVQLEKYNCQ